MVGKCPPGRCEHQLAGSCDPAADHDESDVEESRGRSDCSAHSTPSPRERGSSYRIAAPRVVGERASAAIARRPPTVVHRPCRKRRATRDRFKATATATGTRRAGRIDHHVPDVTRVAASAVDEPTTHDQTGADARRHHHAEHVVDSFAGPSPMLSGRETRSVVVHPHHQTGKARLQP